MWLHILCGPPAAVAAGVLYWRDVLGAPLLPGQDVASQIISYLFSVFVGLVPGYMFGLVPCILHALIMLLLSRVLRSRLMWFAVTPLIGYESSAGILLYVFRDRPAAAGIIETQGVLGAFAAVVCMLLCWKLGKLPTMRVTHVNTA